jgi:hypothetical protein
MQSGQLTEAWKMAADKHNIVYSAVKRGCGFRVASNAAELLLKSLQPSFRLCAKKKNSRTDKPISMKFLVISFFT